MQLEISGTLNPEQIRVLNWNIQKQCNPAWRTDLAQFSPHLDLALFQEVHLGEHFLSCFNDGWSHSFAEGWCTRRRTTGVATVAAVGHVSHDFLVVREPLLRTPKATNITTYALDGSNRHLLVINLHAVNFSLGIQAYERQLKGIVQVLKAHKGPVIFAGDFNTWHPRRERLVRQVAETFLLHEVAFEEDHRTRVFGKCLDYIFTRGLQTTEALIHRVSSSDHNPMLASFSL